MGAKGAIALLVRVKTSHKKMAASCRALYFMFLATLTILDPILELLSLAPLIQHFYQCFNYVLHFAGEECALLGEYAEQEMMAANFQSQLMGEYCD